jgi:outer membrane murein-binding lipoprotein Lpp
MIFASSWLAVCDGSALMNQRTPKLFVVSLTLASVILAGCQRDSGPDLKADVDRLNTQVADLQQKLAAAEKTAESAKDELAQATSAAEARKRELTEKDKAIGQKDEQLRSLQSELVALKRSDAFVFAEISALKAKGGTAKAFEQYQKFITDFPESPLVASASQAIAELKPAVVKDAKWRADLIDPQREERDLLKRFSDGILTTQELVPLLRRRTSAEVLKLLGPPGRTYRNGSEMGYVDKVIDAATGKRATLVIRFEADRVESLRAGYQGREIKP